MATSNLKFGMCRDIIANSNMTKAYVINPCDSCNNDVNTPLNAIHVHIYSDYVIHFECTCIAHTQRRYDTKIDDVMYRTKECNYRCLPRGKDVDLFSSLHSLREL